MSQAAVSEAHADGRLLRSARTRERLVKACLQIATEGRRVPEVRELAELAECSVRTVFERFGSVEGLAAATFDKVLAEQVRAPDGDLSHLPRERRIRLHVGARARIAERWYPAWRLLQRQESSLLENRLEQVRALSRRQIERFYAPEIAAQAPSGAAALLIALEAMLDFPVWARMRERHGLSPRAARAAWQEAIGSMLPQAVIATPCFDPTDRGMARAGWGATIVDRRRA